VSKKIAIQLPDEVVEFIDAEVRARHAPSRAAFVQIALDRERRRLRPRCHESASARGAFGS
jgi:Arc/MetJ-type ribon-helix-helix transcriptional regulator